MTTNRREGPITRHVVRPILLRAGIATDIECRGRMTGTTQRLTLVPVKVDDAWYLLSTYGQTQWAANLRADGCGTMTRKGKTESFRATEVEGDERDRVIAEFHARSPGPIRRIFNRLPDAADHPAFRLQSAPDLPPTAGT